MACKMQCPSCKKMLKEKDDHGKVAQGEYLVINDEIRKLECCECKHISSVSDWTDFEINNY
jgi:hypothetical protein